MQVKSSLRANPQVVELILRRLSERESAARRVRKALENDAFELATGRPVGAEALIRWQNEDGKLVPPNSLIRTAEESGLIVPIGDWVLREACRQANSWHQAYSLAPRIAVNISSQQVDQSDLTQTVMKALFEAGAKPSFLQLELTESILKRDVGKTIATLEIDRSFVMDLEVSNDSATICAAIIAMARELGVTIVAEGVETIPQAEFLKLHKCDQIQVYLFSKPVPASDFEQRSLAVPDTHFALESAVKG